MTTRAKFQCTNVQQSSSAYNQEGHTSSQITLGAVSDAENKTWSKWTPMGEIRLTINNPEALKTFEIGKFYFVDFNEAPAKEKDEK